MLLKRRTAGNFLAKKKVMKSEHTTEGVRANRSFLQRAFFGGNTRNTMIRAGALVLFCAVIFGWVLKPIRVTGISMLPTYQNRGLNFVNLFSYRFGAVPRRGDVVSIGELEHPELEMYMKRIIVLPDETYSISNGYVFINGEPLDEPYVIYRAKWQMRPEKLGPDEYLVIGDNRGMGQEDHVFGRVERRHLVGKVLF